jgi:hypothetical protein
MTTVLEQIDFLLGALSDRPENAGVKSELRTVKEVSTMTPSELPPVPAGSTRYFYNRRELFEALPFLSEHRFEFSLGQDGLYGVDVWLEEQERRNERA